MTTNEAKPRKCACICGCPNEQAPMSWTCPDCRFGRCPLGNPDRRQGEENA